MFARHLLIVVAALGATLVAAAPAQTAPGADRFVSGATVQVESAVTGDLVGVAGDIEVGADVTGDAMVAGGSVRVRGPVGGDLYAAGGNVLVAGAVGGNARIAGGSAELGSQGSVAGDLSIAGGDVEIRGPVKGDVHAAGGTVLIDSAVGGDVAVLSGDLELGPNARIAGQLRYTGPEMQRHPDAQVAGAVRHETRGERHRIERNERHSSSGGGWFWTVGLIALAALLAAAFPAMTRRFGTELRTHPGLAFAFGFAALVLVPIFALLLVITIIGAPLALVVVLLYFLLLLVGYAAVAVVVGDAVLARFKAEAAPLLGWRVGAAMLAMLAIAVLGRIPFVGGIVVFAVLLAGIGAIVMSLRPVSAAPVS